MEIIFNDQYANIEPEISNNGEQSKILHTQAQPAIDEKCLTGDIIGIR